MVSNHSGRNLSFLQVCFPIKTCQFILVYLQSVKTVKRTDFWFLSFPFAVAEETMNKNNCDRTKLVPISCFVHFKSNSLQSFPRFPAGVREKSQRSRMGTSENMFFLGSFFLPSPGICILSLRQKFCLHQVFCRLILELEQPTRRLAPNTFRTFRFDLI